MNVLTNPISSPFSFHPCDALHNSTGSFVDMSGLDSGVAAATGQVMFPLARAALLCVAG
jgi:hypothetical protein